MSERRFFNPTQPQTLQIAVILLYIDAVFSLIGVFIPTEVRLALVLTMAGGAFGIANEKRWGYVVGLIGAVLNVLWPMLYGFSLTAIISGNPLGFLIGVALVALLLHPMSRDYQRIWFK
ncbi:MAG TPA: hypothetical protein VFF40_15225 [Acidimicrobiia bacterium]|nr:hypothetical protein [Acidimicrobiia bacterium]